MIKVILAFCSVFYGVPLLYISIDHSLEAVLFSICLNISFLIIFLLYEDLERKKDVLVVADYSQYRVPNIQLFYIFFLSYFLFKFDVILNLVFYTINGDLLAYMLDQAKNRYSGNSSNSVFDTLATIVFIIYATELGGLMASLKRPSKVIMLAFMIMIIVEGSSLARASILVAFLGLFSELLVKSNRVIYGKSWLSSFKLLLKPIIYGSILFVSVAALRVYSSENILSILYEKFQTYVLASYDLFFVWLNQFERDGYDFGARTFTFIVKLLGEDIQQGNYFPLESRFGFGNIFLNFRGFIEDFGIILTMFIFPLSFVCFIIFAHSRKSFLRYYLCRMLVPIILFPIYSPYFFTVFAVSYLVVPFIPRFTVSARKNA